MSESPTAPTTQDTLVVSRSFRAPIDRVFNAWTQAAELALWFSSSADDTVVPSVDLRVGGNYRIEMHHKNGNVNTVVGTYREIREPEKLVYTWQWEDQPLAVETLVEIDFRSLGDSTEVTVTHQHLPTELDRERHEHGWKACLERLASIV